VLVPSPTVMVPPAKMPKVRRDVPEVSGTLPVPVAGAAADDDALDVADVLELDDDELPELVWDELVPLDPPFMPLSALCTAELSCELTRLRAV
jgi:hypothetical protein